MKKIINFGENMELNNLIEIMQINNINKNEIDKIIKKYKDMYGKNITDEGIYSIIASKYKQLSDDDTLKYFSIKDILPDMQNINIKGKIINIYNNNTNNRVNVLIGDTYNTIYISLTNKQYDENIHILKKGNNIKIINVYSYKTESNIKLLFSENSRMFIHNSIYNENYKQKKINEITIEDRYLTIRGTISNIYKLFHYESCPICKKKLIKNNNRYYCNKCKTRTNPNTSIILELGIDDCTGTIKVAIFDNLVEKILNKDSFSIKKSIQKYSDEGNMAGLEFLIEECEIMGDEIKIAGILKTDHYNKYSINVIEILPINYEEEIEKFLRTIEEEYNDFNFS